MGVHVSFVRHVSTSFSTLSFYTSFPFPFLHPFLLPFLLPLQFLSTSPIDSSQCFLLAATHIFLPLHPTFLFLSSNFQNRSTDLDKWKPHELKAMEVGGNAKAKSFFRDHGVFDMEKIESKYHTSASQQYKTKIKEQVTGKKPPYV